MGVGKYLRLWIQRKLELKLPLAPVSSNINSLCARAISILVPVINFVLTLHIVDRGVVVVSSDSVGRPIKVSSLKCLIMVVLTEKG